MSPTKEPNQGVILRAVEILANSNPGIASKLQDCWVAEHRSDGWLTIDLYTPDLHTRSEMLAPLKRIIIQDAMKQVLGHDFTLFIV